MVSSKWRLTDYTGTEFICDAFLAHIALMHLTTFFHLIMLYSVEFMMTVSSA